MTTGLGTPGHANHCGNVWAIAYTGGAARI